MAILLRCKDQVSKDEDTSMADRKLGSVNKKMIALFFK